jgi:hypothetical protein
MSLFCSLFYSTPGAPAQAPKELKKVPPGPLNAFQLFTVIFSSEYNQEGVPPGTQPGHLGWLWRKYMNIRDHMLPGECTDLPERKSIMTFETLVTRYNAQDETEMTRLLNGFRTMALSRKSITVEYESRTRHMILRQMGVRPCPAEPYRPPEYVNAEVDAPKLEVPALVVLLEQYQTSAGLLSGSVDCFGTDCSSCVSLPNKQEFSSVLMLTVLQLADCVRKVSQAKRVLTVQ